MQYTKKSNACNSNHVGCLDKLQLFLDKLLQPRSIFIATSTHGNCSKFIQACMIFYSTLTSRWRGTNSSLSNVRTSPFSSSISSPPFSTSLKFSTLVTVGDAVSSIFPRYLPSLLPRTGILLPDGELTGFPPILLSSLSMKLTDWSLAESKGSFPSRESRDWMDSVWEGARNERLDPAREAGLELTDGTLCQWRGTLWDLSWDNGEKGWKGMWRGTPQTDS